jgi:hypothetical protein
MAVDVDGVAGSTVPRIDHKPVHPGFLYRLSECGILEIVRRLVMTARLQPAAKGTMMDQKDPSSGSIEHEGRGCDMPREGVAGMNVISIGDLAPKESMPLIGHTEGSGVIVQKPSDMMPEGGRVEAHGCGA